MRRALVIAAWSLLSAASSALGQFETGNSQDAENSHGIRFGEQLTQRWKVGIIVRAAGAPCVGVYGTAPIPRNWPEQTVKKVKEDASPQVKNLGYRTLENGVEQMLVTIPELNTGETAQVIAVFEVTRRAILPPEDPKQFVVPQKRSRELRPFLGKSPYIEIGNPKIRSLAREVVQDKELAWEKVEAIYDWVRAHIEYRNGALKGALAALRDGTGDCEELTSLFIALCRVNGIPARTVWVPGHCYPEFYLEDKEGNGHWIPCQVAGTRDFGGMPDRRPILQKGDNFQVPEKSEPQRYVAEFLKVKSVGGIGKPEVKFIGELAPAN